MPAAVFEDLEVPLIAEDHIAAEQRKTLLRILTCGSVDDGKSTLIGRLLHDSRNVYEDQLLSIINSGVNRSSAAVDLSLLTDGLRAEREQGITIDVAYRYFTTARRKFILADTPGHEQFTRNMATGASTADVAIILIDARYGVLPQSRRHAYICSLLGIRTAVVAINKMDLVDYDEGVYQAIRAEFEPLLKDLGFVDPYFLAASALVGDNIVDRGSHPRIAWFRGPSLLEYLEAVEPLEHAPHQGFRFAVQLVIRPNLDFRGYAGVVASGVIRVGDEIRVWPSRRTSRIARIVTYDGDLAAAFQGQSVTLTLEDEIDIARGELFTHSHEAPIANKHFAANVVWMQDGPLRLDRPWLIKHTSRQVRARAVRLRHRVDIGTFNRESATQLGLNEIGVVEFESALPLFFDPYTENRSTGGFIIIDPETNATAGAGMLLNTVAAEFREVRASDRVARYGHQAEVLRLGSRVQLAKLLERRIFDRGGVAVAVSQETNDAALAVLRSAGLIVILTGGEGSALPEDDHAALDLLLEKIFGAPDNTQGDGI